jgi:hypothetical protein
MTLDQIKNQLQTQYQIDHFIDLAEFDQLPRGKLYTALRRLHKPEFANNERVVFVAVGSLKKSYIDQPHDIITALQQYIQHHDIPHFFVIVVTNNRSIAQELEYVRAKYNPQEEMPMSHVLADD